VSESFLVYRGKGYLTVNSCSKELKVKKLNVGIVGCGEVAQTAHLPIIQDSPNANLTAICDTRKEVVRQVQRRYSFAKIYFDYHNLFEDKEIDAVLVLGC